MLAGAFRLDAVILTSTHLKLSFSDRDLMMRYHWGLGIGHCYACNSTSESCSASDEPRDMENDQYADLELDNTHIENAGDAYESDNSELGLVDDRDPECWEDVETSDSSSDSDCPSEDGSEDED